MDTLRFYVTEEPAKTEDGKEVPGWILLEVGYEIGSLDPYTEEDRKRDEERRKEAQRRKEEDEKQYGEAAMKALEEQMNAPKVEDRIQ
jgi:sensor histidine kinase YesM